MARQPKPSSTGEWMQKLGEQLGVELGEIIAASVQRTIASRIDMHEMARRLGAGSNGHKLIRGSSGKALRGRPAASLLASRPGCADPGCEDPVLAKGLCRSHYYRARYESQKSAKPPARRLSK